jgi:hypothetical protein
MPFQSVWTKEKIEKSYKDFIKKNGRQPTLPEINNAPDMPSVRQIQRIYGSVPRLRESAGLERHEAYLSQGSHRSQIASQSYKNSRQSEKQITKELISLFGEHFVHIERPVNYEASTKIRFDCFVFSPDGNFAVDIFTTETVHDLASNLYIKFSKYKDFRDSIVYLVLDTKGLDRGDVSKLTTSRLSLSNKNIIVILYKDFIKEVSTMNKYKL